MLSRIALFLMIAAAAFGATFRLYLKDGTYQTTSEYKVLPDRVRYYSTERGDWEEIPLELVDLERTKKEVAAREEERKEEVKAQAAEDKALETADREVEQIPPDPGAYYVHGDKLETIKAGESKIVNNKTRNVLKVLSPVPMVAGKATVEMDGASSPMKISDPRPEFYFRLSEFERFGIIKLTPTKKGTRIVETLNIIPVSKEIIQEQIKVETFKKQVGDLVYKIWPEKPLEPGEYALVEFMESEGQESINIQVWDFSIVPGKN